MIPNRCIFLFLGRMEFSLVSYLAVRSAATVNQPYELVLYYEDEPTGRWWQLAREFITRTVQVEPPRWIGTVELKHPAHQADILRLDLLQRDGGIYLDLDVLSVRPLTPFLQEHFVLGREGQESPMIVCNGVILAEPDSAFGNEWRKGFDPRISRWRGFRSHGRDEYWNEISGQYPAFLAEEYPELITIAAYDAFHWPMWHREHLEQLFRGRGNSYPNAYCHHLWQSLSAEPYLNALTPGYILQDDTNFNLMARPYFVADDSATRNSRS